MSWDAFEPKRGVKRGADDTQLNDEQRFAKRFNLLNIGSSARPNANSNYYIPVSPRLKPLIEPPKVSTNGTHEAGDGMQVDETKDKVYIHNLDDELADIEADEPEPKLIFLPDIEKRFSRIPQHLLTARSATDGIDSGHQELVLYSVPKSLTVDEGRDSVRKAIIETRQRAREKAMEEARHDDMMRKYDSGAHDIVTETAHGYGTGYEADTEPGNEDDPDAMDLG